MARAGNRDVALSWPSSCTASAGAALLGATGRHDICRRGRQPNEGAVRLCILALAVGAARVVHLPSPQSQFDRERMFGFHRVTEISAGAPFTGRAPERAPIASTRREKS
jgi:hypothetical protein